MYNCKSNKADHEHAASLGPFEFNVNVEFLVQIYERFNKLRHIDVAIVNHDHAHVCAALSPNALWHGQGQLEARDITYMILIMHVRKLRLHAQVVTAFY